MSRGGPPDISGMHTLKVDNIPEDVSTDALRDAFSKYGDIGDVYIPRAPGSSRHRGFAFVRFRDLAAAEDAIKGMDGFDMDGKHLAVVMALNKRPEGRRGGGSDRDRDRRGRSHSRSRSRDRYRRGGRSRSASPRGRYEERRSSRRGRSPSRSRSRSRSYDRDRRRRSRS